MPLEERRMCGHFGLAGQRSMLRKSGWLVDQVPARAELRQDLIQETTGTTVIPDVLTVFTTTQRESVYFTSDKTAFPKFQMEQRPFKVLTTVRVLIHLYALT